MKISHCNNIEAGELEISPNKLNIIFASNGTGKSTIAKAILLKTAKRDSALVDLMPFKYRANNPNKITPNIEDLSNINTVLCFDERYVNSFVFKEDELLQDSFSILIKTETYKKLEIEIAELVAKVKELFSENTEIDFLIDKLRQMTGLFTLTKTGISRASAGMKGLAKGNKIEHIPSGLEPYTNFIRSVNSFEWVDWQTKGQAFAITGNNCPFCAGEISSKKEQIAKVGQEYDKTTIKNLLTITELANNLGEYFSAETKNNLAAILALQDGLGKEHESFLVELKKQIDNLIEKLEKIKTLSGFQFKEGENVGERLPEYIIDLNFFDRLKSDKTIAAVTPINKSIIEVSNKAGVLQGKVNQQRAVVNRLVSKHENEMNDFLAYAGYKYTVGISGVGENAQLKLKHSDYTQQITRGNQHLSFGERNAFAIVLFMYECLSKKPDLIILDDPISSFDKNKKYAILQMLFRRDTSDCLKKMTVLMLTHDIEPVIDAVKSLRDQFQNQTKASFLRLSKGIITDIPVQPSDIQTFAQICNNVIKSNVNDIIKLIYLRRYYEIVDDKDDSYQVLSNLFHKRSNPEDFRKNSEDGQKLAMDHSEYLAGCSAIKEKISSFEYYKTISEISDKTKVIQLYKAAGNGYEKLQLFRLLPVTENNTIIQKFINETYHIENEFVCQLDPTKFDIIPEYIINECDKIVDSLK